MKAETRPCIKYGTAGIVSRPCSVCGETIEANEPLWCIPPRPDDSESLAKYVKDVCGECGPGKIAVKKRSGWIVGDVVVPLGGKSG